MADSAPKTSETGRAPQTAERRAWVRYPPRRLEMLWHLFGMKPPEQRSSRIQDISSQGIGLVVDRAFAQGSVLVLRFPGTSLDSRPVLVRVKHLQPLDNGEFKVGCTFVVPLSEAQLAELI
jgi:PilZ domain